MVDKFIILSRGKNLDFISEYNLTKQIQKDMLMALTIEDYLDCEESINFPGKYVHKLSHYYNIILPEGEIEQAHIYIKFEIENEEIEDQTVIISFHRLEFPVQHPFTIQEGGAHNDTQ